jgi:hypothetical protein
MKDNDENLSQTENFIIWRSDEDGEFLYHIELGGVTLHLLSDEWDELVSLIQEASLS